MEIREYVDLIAQGKVMEALQVIRSSNPFPSICAHVCTHPCEDACRRSQPDKPIAIRALKRFAVEFGGDRMAQTEAEAKYGEGVAVVGSGPAGLACAYYLRKLGYPVTIFEAHSEPGGMLRVGIPQYRLPREVLDTEVQRLIQMGVEIRRSTRVVSLDVLFEMGYKAIFLTLGAHQGLRMGIEGEESPGVVDGVTFLREVNLGLKPSLGERVAVVGGGNVAIDAARTALRLGAKRVVILYRRSRAEMPADPAEVEQALEEGIEILVLVAPTRVKRGNGRLSITCIRMELGEPDAGGRHRPMPIKDSEFDEEFDTLVTAIGQAPQIPGDFHLHIGKGSTIQVDPATLTTLDESGIVQIPANQCQACGICVAQCPARVIILRKPYDRRHITEELDHALRSAAESKFKPLIIGFCCQYGLFGTGALASLWRRAKAGIWIVPVLCIAKVEAEHILRAFEMGAEGVFIAGCGEQCAREKTAFWVSQQVERVRKVLVQLGLASERVQMFNLYARDEDLAHALDEFTEKIGGLYLASVIKQEVKS
jgi:NADPH-dependent glutamate synthase beta subunit-like oxidoreductase/coenzyme F420-reducing hydrogenase delta subunit